MNQQQPQPTAFEINEAIKKRAERIQAERGYSSSYMVKARSKVLANLKSSQKETLLTLAKSGNAIDLQTQLHAFTDLSVEAIDSFLALVKGKATDVAFNEFCRIWNIK